MSLEEKVIERTQEEHDIADRFIFGTGTKCK